VGSDASEPTRLAGRAGSAARVPPLALLVLAAALALVHLALPLASLLRLVPLNYNEGWNAYHAEAVFSERPLYPAADALFPNNYPPLSFVLIAWLARGLGDPIRVGRLLSVAALFVIAVEIGWLARLATGSTRLGGFAAFLFVALMGACFGDYVGMNDPQLMAHALMLGGLVLVAGGQSWLRLAGAALLIGVGGLVKHSPVALPLAITGWLFGRDRRAFGRWLAVSAGVVVAALAALLLPYGTIAFESILRPRPASLRIAAGVSPGWLAGLSAPLALALLAAQPAWRDRLARLLLLYGALALGVGFALTTGEGVSYNAYFDLLIALCLLGAFLLRTVQLAPADARLAPAWVLALGMLIWPLLEAPHALLGLGPRILELEASETATLEDVGYLTSSAGPCLCETLTLCFWAGKPAEVDLFNSRQDFRSGLVEEEKLLARIARGEFAVVQLTGIWKDRDDNQVSAQLARELLRHYVVDRVSTNGVFLRPRRDPSHPAS